MGRGRFDRRAEDGAPGIIAPGRFGPLVPVEDFAALTEAMCQHRITVRRNGLVKDFLETVGIEDALGPLQQRVRIGLRDALPDVIALRAEAALDEAQTF